VTQDPNPSPTHWTHSKRHSASVGAGRQGSGEHIPLPNVAPHTAGAAAERSNALGCGGGQSGTDRDARMSSLSGLRIADFSRILAGPLATMVLADLGADVIKIERPGSGDDTRAWGPPYDSDGTATYFLAANRNKSSVTIDLSSEPGRLQARSLAIESGIVVENFRPGVMDRLGLGYDSLRESRPDLVFCSINAFGSGAGASLPGYDLLVQAVGGLMSVTGEADGDPQKVGVALVDVIAGLFAAVGVLAAVRHREHTGEGQLVEVDLLSALLAALVNQASAFTAAGVIGSRRGNEHPSIAPYETLPTADGQLALAVGNDKQFAALCAVLDIPSLATDPSFATNSMRVANRSALKRELSSRLAARSTADWVLAMATAGVPAGPVNNIKEAFALAQSLGLEPIVTVGDKQLTRSPIRLSATPVTYRLAPPDLPSTG
jgi:crotonobetainyl-CoA:carnitine CoA-transferase CaiB-like acyl-CoA transferase